MFLNYILIAFRNINRQLSYSLINIFGLAIGIACSLVMFLFVYSEWSYDRHFQNADRIYKVGTTFFNMGHFAVSSESLGDELPKEFEGVEAFTRIKKVGDLAVSVNNQPFIELAYYTDSSFFKIFSYEFKEGDRSEALNGPGKIVLTERVARKYFGNEPAIGKVVEVGKEKENFIVTAVVVDDDRSSQLKSSIWLSIDKELKHDPSWTSAAFYNYILLREKNTQQDLELALDRILEKKVYVNSAGVPPGLSFEDYKNHENAVKFYVNPLKDVHLKSTLIFEISAGGNESSMYTFAAISAFILLLASVNFINLTTARASRRAKEVGIRKAVGSNRCKLIVQFTTESIVVSLIAMMLSLVFAELFMNVFELVTGDRLLNTLWNNGLSILILFLFAIVVGLLSGIYPAFYLTSFSPVKVLKGNLSSIGGGQFRNFLVVIQFSISICLMICSAVIVRQMDFMKTKDLGFNQQSMVTIDGVDKLKNQLNSFKNELSQLSGVTQASLHTGEPGSKMIMSFNAFQTPEMKEPVTMNVYFGDVQFVETMGFRIVAGRSFDKDIASDSSAVILTESAVKQLGLKTPIGAEVNKGQYVIGVVHDFHWESLRNSIAPVALMIGKNFYQMGFRLNANARTDFLMTAEKKWKQFLPGEPFKYHFLGDNFGELLKKERVFSKAIGFFTILAVFISCLGLYGLSAYTAEQRIREIGIRKVLGASAANIVSMLNRKFALLVSISILIATPVSFYMMIQWIDGFAYKAELQVWVFLAVIVSAFVIALLTVSFHSLKAALINPADTLKYE